MHILIIRQCLGLLFHNVVTFIESRTSAPFGLQLGAHIQTDKTRVPPPRATTLVFRLKREVACTPDKKCARHKKSGALKIYIHVILCACARALESLAFSIYSASFSPQVPRNTYTAAKDQRRKKDGVNK